MSEKEKHHYLPQAFINAFVGWQQVYAFNAQNITKGYTVKVKKITAAQFGYINNFYLLDSAFKAQLPQLGNLSELHIEDISFITIENNYTKLVKDVLSTGHLHPKDAELFIHSLASIKVRNPYRRTTGTPLNIRLPKDYLKALAIKTAAVGNTSRNMARKLINARLAFYNSRTFTDSWQKYTLIRRHQQPRLFNTIYQNTKHVNWVLLEAPPEARFICTDNPGYNLFEGKLDNFRFGKSFMWFFPLTSRYCFFITCDSVDKSFREDEGKRFIFYPIDEATVNDINECGLKFAYKYVFADEKEVLEKYTGYFMPQEA